MLSIPISETSITRLNDLITNSNKVVLTCHVGPDGDAIGSTLGLSHILTAMGKSASVVTPDQCPRSLRFLPGANEIISYSCNPDKANQVFRECDLIFCLDFNSLTRVDALQDAFKLTNAPMVLIDHHLYPEHFAEIEVSDHNISSTCLLLYKVICKLQLNKYIDSKVANCIYAGMMTDTGNFTYNSSDPYIYTTISELINCGLQKEFIYKQIYNTNSESRIKLNAYALCNKLKVYSRYHAALIWLTECEQNEYAYSDGDTEGLVNVPLSIPGVVYSIFLRSSIDNEGRKYVKISMRSVGNFPVNTICSNYYNGGGHKNASGGEFYGSIEQAIEIFESLLEENNKLIEEIL